MRYRGGTTDSQNIRHFGKCLVTVVTINPVGRCGTSQIRGCDKQINMGIVVKIPEESLNSKVSDIAQTCAVTYIRKTTGTVVLKQPRCSRSVIQNEAVHVAIIINVSKIAAPGLFAVIQPRSRALIRILVCSIVSEQPVDAPTITRTGHSQPTFREVNITETIIVVVRLNDCVVSAGYARREGCPNQSPLQRESPGPVILVGVVVIIVIARKQVDIPIIVKIRENRPLHKNITIWQLHERIGLGARSCLEQEGSTG